MKHKMWINFIVVLALALGLGGVVPDQQPAAQAASTAAKLRSAPWGISGSGEVTSARRVRLT
jgi:hypothetical protein